MLGLTGDTLLARIGAGMASGAGVGALSGFGEGEGGFANRLGSAETGAAWGAALGAAAPVVGNVAGKIVGAGARAAEGARNRISGEQPFRQAATILGHGGEEPVTVAIAPHILAAHKLAGIAAADAVTPEVAAAAAPEAMLAELGPNLTGFAGGIVARPGTGQRLIKEATDVRLAGATKRINQALDDTLGPNRDLLQTADDISAAQEAAADPLYAAVRDKPVFASDNLRLVLNTQAGKKALGDAQRLAEGFGEKIDPAMPTIGSMDRVKQALDDQIGIATRAGASKKAASLISLKKTFVNELDRQVPQYAVARNAWAGPAAVKDALADGQGVFGSDLSPAALRRHLNTLSQSERVAYAMGARGQVAQVMGTARSDPTGALSLFNKSWNADKLKILLGPQRTATLMQTLERERDLKAFGQDVLYNSKTASRVLANKALEDQGMMRHLLGTARLAFAVNGLRGLANIGMTHAVEGLLASHDIARNEQVAELVARGLTKSGPERDALIKALNAGLAKMNAIDRKTSGAAALVRKLTSAVGVTATPIINRQVPQQP